MNDYEKKCDICHGPMPNVYYDAVTRLGPWADMCPPCFHELGIKLGTGWGQKYALIGSPEPKWTKVEG